MTTQSPREQPAPRLACRHRAKCQRCTTLCDRYEIADEDREAQRRIDEAWQARIDNALDGGCCGG